MARRGRRRGDAGMRPQDTRVWRRDGRKARKGIPTGRRTIRHVETTYGRHQRDRERCAEWTAFFAARREAELAYAATTPFLGANDIGLMQPEAEVTPRPATTGESSSARQSSPRASSASRCSPRVTAASPSAAPRGTGSATGSRDGMPAVTRSQTGPKR